MTKTFIAFNVARTQMVTIPCDCWTFKVAELDNDGWIRGICLAGGEYSLIADMLWHLDNPAPDVDEDYEPEYTLAGGYAAYDC